MRPPDSRSQSRCQRGDPYPAPSVPGPWWRIPSQRPGQDRSLRPVEDRPDQDHLTPTVTPTLLGPNWTRPDGKQRQPLRRMRSTHGGTCTRTGRLDPSDQVAEQVQNGAILVAIGSHSRRCGSDHSSTAARLTCGDAPGWLPQNWARRLFLIRGFWVRSPGGPPV